MGRERCACWNSGRPGYVKRRREAYSVNLVGSDWDIHEECGGTGWIYTIDEHSRKDINITYRKDY
jgi:hypothetical protein